MDSVQEFRTSHYAYFPELKNSNAISIQYCFLCVPIGIYIERILNNANFVKSIYTMPIAPTIKFFQLSLIIALNLIIRIKHTEDK